MGPGSPSDKSESSFLVIVFLVMFTFWVVIIGSVYVMLKGIGNETQECIRDGYTPPVAERNQ